MDRGSNNTIGCENINRNGSLLFKMLEDQPFPPNITYAHTNTTNASNIHVILNLISLVIMPNS